MKTKLCESIVISKKNQKSSQVLLITVLMTRHFLDLIVDVSRVENLKLSSSNYQFRDNNYSAIEIERKVKNKNPKNQQQKV